ncbi:hypothetical protein KKC60_00945 [Patescibacteria group bacterium]|nr:hypothetical protein [Patescibacteria group bacterium]
MKRYLMLMVLGLIFAGQIGCGNYSRFVTTEKGRYEIKTPGNATCTELSYKDGKLKFSCTCESTCKDGSIPNKVISTCSSQRDDTGKKFTVVCECYADCPDQKEAVIEATTESQQESTTEPATEAVAETTTDGGVSEEPTVGEPVTADDAAEMVSDGGGAETMPENTPEANVETSTEQQPEAQTEVTAETTTESSTETSSEIATETTADGGVEMDAETVPETTTETLQDGGDEATPESSGEMMTEMSTETTPGEGEMVAEANSDKSVETCGTNEILVNQHCVHKEVVLAAHHDRNVWGYVTTRGHGRMCWVGIGWPFEAMAKGLKHQDVSEIRFATADSSGKYVTDVQSVSTYKVGSGRTTRADGVEYYVDIYCADAPKLGMDLVQAYFSAGKLNGANKDACWFWEYNSDTVWIDGLKKTKTNTKFRDCNTSAAYQMCIGSSNCGAASSC